MLNLQNFIFVVGFLDNFETAGAGAGGARRGGVPDDEGTSAAGGVPGHKLPQAFSVDH